MLSLPAIIFESFKSTSQKPGWWILAFLQGVSLVVSAYAARSNSLAVGYTIVGLALGILVFVPATAGLWLEARSGHAKQITSLSFKTFLGRCKVAAGISVLLFAALFAYRPWIFVAAFTSIVVGTAVMAMLYAILWGMPLVLAWRAALQAWKSKISLVVVFSVCIMVAHMVFLSLARAFLGSSNEFSFLWASATILLILAGIVLVASFFLAVLNCFLVILFLETIKPIKIPEAEKTATNVVIPTVVPESNA